MMRAIDVLESQEVLKLFKIQDWQNMKDAQRSKLYKDLQKRAYPSTIREEKKALTTKELAEILNKG